MAGNEIAELEEQIRELMEKLNERRKASRGVKVRNYVFGTLDGETTLLDLFAGQDKLLVIHNMGQGCRYCTLWPMPIIVPTLTSANVPRHRGHESKAGSA